MSLSIDSTRLLAASGMVLTYVAMCYAIARNQRRKRRDALQRIDATSTGWIVAYASQTGTSEELAQQTAATLRLAGVSVHLCELSELGIDALRNAERVLFITSTYGEGDPPDNAAIFVERVMESKAGDQGNEKALTLPHVHYALLALGDSTYTAYCGFGKTLDQWLQQHGAQPLFNRIEIDRNDPVAIDLWRQQLSHLAGTTDAADWTGPPFSDWRLMERRMLNPESAGEPVFHLELEPADGRLNQQAEWQSGDLAQIIVPTDPQRPREYSIASIAEENRVHLLLRLHRHTDGSLGHASGWLGTEMPVGNIVKMRLRQHRRFQLADNADRPLILIGNGTGIAGLRGHLKAREKNGRHANWLIFGERNAACDFHYQDEIKGWLASGVLERLDTAFSRDQPGRRYVQHCLQDAGDTLRSWIERGAAIYVCGSLKGMASGVDDALHEILGKTQLDQLTDAGRYRRDVY